MLIIPAIDLSRGRCVRLYQGRREKETFYSDDPVQVARLWERRGAERLHLVDLDGAFEGRPLNSDIIAQIVRKLHIPVQLGGGLRDAESVKNAFSLGVSKVVLGTVCVHKPALFEQLASLYGPRLIVGIDAREGVVAVKGWLEETQVRAHDLAKKALALGLEEIIYTDIMRDGSLAGPNFKALEEMLSIPGIKIIASGGIASLEDLKMLSRMEEKGLIGAIVGKALYDGCFTLEEAIRAVTSS